METKPTASHSPDEWVNESQISAAAATIYDPTAPDKKPPAARPDGEDIDVEVPPEIKRPDASETKVVEVKPEVGRMSELKYGDEFPPPPLDFSDLPEEEENFSDPMYSCPSWSNDVFNVDPEDTDSTFASGITNLTHLTVRECIGNNSESVVSSLPFADEDPECDVSESGVSELVEVVDEEGEQSTQCEMSPVRDVQAVNTPPDDRECIMANNINKDEDSHDLDFKTEVSESPPSTLQREISQQNEVSLESVIQSDQEYSGNAEELEDNIEPNASPDELTETNSTAFSANDNKKEEVCIDILHDSDSKCSISESFVSTSLAGDVSQQLEELFPQHELHIVSEIQSGAEHSGNVFNAEVGESEDLIGSKALPDTIEPEKALPDELHETHLLVHSPFFADQNKNMEVYTLQNLDEKSNLPESTVLALPAEPSVSEIQAGQEYFGAEVEEREDTDEPIPLPDELINVIENAFPANCGEHIVQSPFFAEESSENEEAHKNSIQNSDYICDVVSGSTVVDVSEQQGEQSLQNDLPPLRVNQEATQQVLSQASPPLSAVAMETANPMAPSEGSGEVMGESRVGHGTAQGESRPKSADESRFRERKGVEQKSEKPRGVRFQLRTMESDSCDESDSGVSADFSPGSTLESSGSSGSTCAHKETPIEREIRRAIEREHSLRRSRGLPNPPSSPEYVEIPLRKAALYQTPTKSEKGQGKDRQLAGKKMQKDIHEETKRENDLVKLGKVPGFYDKGTVRQLKEKRQLFEAFQKSSDSCSVKSNAVSSSETDSLCHKAKSTRSDVRNELTIKSPKVVPEAKSCQIIIIENNFDLPAARPHTSKGAITVVDSSLDNKTRQAEDDKAPDLKAPKDNPFFKLRSSTSALKVEQDIREAQERERELHRQRINLYGPRAERGGGRPAGTEGHSGTLSSLKASPVQDLPDSSQTGITSTTAARHSSERLGAWPPAPNERNHQTEVPPCRRPPRQKNPLVQRWESGLINAQED